MPNPAKWTYFYLYVILDVSSRYVVGWTVQYGGPARGRGATDHSRDRAEEDHSWAN
jgi:transposase InsO family protein